MEVVARQRVATPRPDRRRASGGMNRRSNIGCEVAVAVASAGEVKASKGNKAQWKDNVREECPQGQTERADHSEPEKRLEVVKTARGQRLR